MGADRVVMPPPGFDQHFGFDEAVEDLAIEQFVAKRPVDPQGGEAKLSLVPFSQGEAGVM